jgi:hypothetical protein
MASGIRSRRRSFKASSQGQGKFVHRPQGVLSPRVEKAGPQRFGVVCCDCHKGCSKWMLCDFYGKVLSEPQELRHTRGHFQAALAQRAQVRQEHRLKDLIVVVERTGNYPWPVKSAFAQAG